MRRERSIFRGLTAFLGWAAALLAACAAVVWPVWLLATTRTRLYDALVLLAIASSVVALVVRRARARAGRRAPRVREPSSG